jgi:hypothetical protein
VVFAAYRPALHRHRRELHGLHPIGASADPLGSADRLLTFLSRALPGPSRNSLAEAPPLAHLSVCAPPPTDRTRPLTRDHRWTLRSLASRHRLAFRPRGFPPPRRFPPERGSRHVAAGTGPGVRRVSPGSIVTSRGWVGSRPGFPPTRTPYEGFLLAGSRTASLRPLPSCRSWAARPRSSDPPPGRSQEHTMAPRPGSSAPQASDPIAPFPRPPLAPLRRASRAGRLQGLAPPTSPWHLSPLPATDARSFHGFLSPPRPASRRWCPGSRPDPIPRPVPRAGIRRSRPAAGSRLSDVRVHDLAVAGLPGVFDVKERLDLGIGFARKLD